MEALLRGRKGTREWIITSLAERWPLTAKQLYLRVSKKTSCTYQAVHKSLNLLLKEGVLLKEGRTYKLQMSWLKALRKDAHVLEHRYRKQTKKDAPFDDQTLTFKTAMSMGRFVINKFASYPNPQKKPSICLWRHAYSLIGLSKEEIQTLGASAKEQQYYILCNKNAPFDRVLANAYRQMGGKVKLGVDVVGGSPDFFIHGDYISEVYSPLGYKKEMDGIYNSYAESFNPLHLTTVLREKPYTFVVRVTRNAKLAQHLRSAAIKHFTEEEQSFSPLPISVSDHVRMMAKQLLKSRYWREIHRDAGSLPFCFYENVKEAVAWRESFQQSRPLFAGLSEQLTKLIFDYFAKKRQVESIVSLHSLRQHYHILKNARGEAAAEKLLKNPEKAMKAYGIKLRVLEHSFPFSVVLFEGGTWLLYEDKTTPGVKGVQMSDPKMAVTYERMFTDCWNQAKPYSWKEVREAILTPAPKPSSGSRH